MGTVVAIVVGVQYAVKSAESRSAFVRWRAQILDVDQDVDIYQRHAYPNAPVMALLLYPLARLPRIELGTFTLDVGALSWFLAKLGMTVLALLGTVRLLASKAKPFPLVALAVVLLLSLRPIIGDLSHGNVNLLILFLVVAALYLFHRGWDTSAGLVLALGICCKVTPGLFLPYFLWKRAWKAVAGCIAGLLLFFIVVPGAFLGPARNWELLNSWLDTMIWPYVRDGQVWTEHNNQSIPGVVYRLTTASPSFLDENDQPQAFDNILTLDPALARWIVRGCGVGFLLLMCWSCRTPLRPREDWRLAAEYSVVILGMLLLSERTWKHHCVTLLLPYAVLCWYAATQATHGWRIYLIGTLSMVVLLMSSTSTTVWELFGDRIGAKMAQVYGAYVWAELLLLLALVLILRKHRHDSQPSTTEETVGARVEDRLAERVDHYARPLTARAGASSSISAS